MYSNPNPSPINRKGKKIVGLHGDTASNTSHNPQYLSYPAPPNSNMLYRPPMGSSSGMDVPQYSTQIGPEPQLSAPVGLETITSMKNILRKSLV
jgi:hypothetical protein